MELIIIALIAVEVVIVRIQVPSHTTVTEADRCCSASYAMDRSSGKWSSVPLRAMRLLMRSVEYINIEKSRSPE